MPVVEEYVVPPFTSVVAVPLVLLAPTPWLVVTPPVSTPVALVVVPPEAPPVAAPAAPVVAPPVVAPPPYVPPPYVPPVLAPKPYRN